MYFFRRYNTNSSCCGGPDKPPKDFTANKHDEYEADTESDEDDENYAEGLQKNDCISGWLIDWSNVWLIDWLMDV